MVDEAIKEAAELQKDIETRDALIQKGADAVKKASAEITTLTEANDALKKAASDQEAAVVELTDDIIDRLVKTGFITEDERVPAKDGIKDPVKVAAQLQTVLKRIEEVPIGIVGTTSEKPASDSERSAADVDDTFRQSTGIA